MPELNFSVKIVGGERTPQEVWVAPLGRSDKKITLQNGGVVKPEDVVSVIDKAIKVFQRP